MPNTRYGLKVGTQVREPCFRLWSNAFATGLGRTFSPLLATHLGRTFSPLRLEKDAY